MRLEARGGPYHGKLAEFVIVGSWEKNIQVLQRVEESLRMR